MRSYPAGEKMRSHRRFTTTLIPLVVLVAATIYWRALPFRFSRDDTLHLENAARWSRPPTRLLEHFSEDFWAGHPAAGLYRPFTAATIQATAWLSGLAPAPLRAGNILLLVLMALASAFCAWRGGTSRTGALLLALLIAAHPLFSEDVVEVVSRSELLAATFSLLAGALWMGESISIAAALGGGVCLSCALLSKEGAFGALPGLAVVLLRRPEGARRRGSASTSGVA